MRCVISIICVAVQGGLYLAVSFITVQNKYDLYQVVPFITVRGLQFRH